MISTMALRLRRLSWLLLSLVLPLAAAADTVGVIIAPAGETLAEQEALVAEAVIAGLVGEGHQAALLHAESPFVRAHGVEVPAVAADDDWTPLDAVLGRLAVQLRLDHCMVLAATETDKTLTARARIVVRGGPGAGITAGVPADGDAVGSLAQQMVERINGAIAQLPRPADPGEDAVPAAGPPAPERSEPAAPPDGSADGDQAPGALEAATGSESAEAPAAGAAGSGSESELLIAARNAYSDGHHELAYELLSEYAEQHGPTPEYFMLRARLNIASQRPEDAIGDLRRVIDVSPEHVEARVWLGRLLSDQGLWQQAVSHYQAALESDPTRLDALLGLARLWRDHGHRGRAIELLAGAYAQGQTDPSLLALLAELHELEGDTDIAEQYYLEAAQRADEDEAAAVLERLGDLYASQQRHREALSCYSQAATLNPSRAGMVERRYAEVMRAADNAVYEALTSGWSVWEDYVTAGVGERELVFRELAHLQRQVKEAMLLADSVTPPGDARADHARRQFAYSVAVEAMLAALTHLDLGREDMRQRALERRNEALAELQALRGGEAG